MVVNFTPEADSILEEYPFLFQNYFMWELQLDLKVRSQGYWLFGFLFFFFTQGFESILSFCSLQM